MGAAILESSTWGQPYVMRGGGDVARQGVVAAILRDRTWGRTYWEGGRGAAILERRTWGRPYWKAGCEIGS